MRKIMLPILVGLATALCQILQAQPQSVFAAGADSVLRFIDKTPVTSGYLYDRALPMSRYDVFNNDNDTSYYEYATQAYLELYQAAYKPWRMTKPEKLASMVTMQNLQNKIPIQVLDYNYQQIKPGALKEGLLTFSNGAFYNVAGKPNLYITKRLQLTTLLADKVESNEVTFMLLPHFISRNTGLDVKQVQISGAGIIKTLMGPLDSVTVTLPGNGKHYITLTTTLSNGSQFSTKNLLVIGENSASTYKTDGASFAAPDPCVKKSFEGTIPWQGYTDTLPYRGKFDLSIYYRAGVDCVTGINQEIRNPVILIDGFDATDKRTAINKVLYSKFLRYIDDSTNPRQPDTIDFVRVIRSHGFDVILVDIPTYYYHVPTGQIIPLDSNANNAPPGYSLADGEIIRGGGDYIERNALTMVTLLQDINAQLQANGSTEKIVLIGPSMGGQITRYALKYMEDRGIDHNVRLWISQDSNHEGAVTPISEQMVISALAGSLVAAKNARDKQLLAPAAKQFLLDHFAAHPRFGLTNAMSAAGFPGFQQRYQNVIDSIGWPARCRKIATISGAENGKPLNVPSAGELTMYIEAKTHIAYQNGLGPFLIGAMCQLFPDNDRCTPLKVNMYTAPAPDKTGKVASLFVKGIVNTEFYTKGSTLTRNQSLEAAQSGYYWGYEELALQLKKFQWDASNNVLLQYNTGIFPGYHPIQPTGSTLAYGKGANPNVYNGYQPKWDDDVTGLNLSCDKYIPFDAYMGPKTFSVLHDSIFYPQAQVIISEIRGIIPDYPKPTRTVRLQRLDNSKYYFCPGETQQFEANSLYYSLSSSNLQWTVNSDKFEIVAGQGTPSVSIKYLGGMTFDEYMALGGVKISVAEETPCYRISVPEPLGAGVGDIWSGTMTGVYSNQSKPLVYPPAMNFSDRANIKLVAGLTFKENALQNYTLMQNLYGTPLTWSVTTVVRGNRQENQLNMTSDRLGQYLYKVSDSNRCFRAVNSFYVQFGRTLLWRVSPNPASDEIMITKQAPDGYKETGKPSTILLSIYDSYRKQALYSHAYINNGESFRVPVSQLPDGEYVIQIQYGKEVYNEKVFVRR
jgi:pimeloyl-ACP methyl ester carboxylesterase